ncbi:MAG: two-component sensor histidine kinase [Prevotellaceae bacterium]|jgi:signal transduction histidine kinase|nr:two-component sensor histidine kinase [Prevotellaceae bacterium]
MKLSYKQRLTISFCIILAGFTAGIATFEQYRERAYKTEALEEKLDACADITHRYIDQYGSRTAAFDSLLPLLPPTIRLTWIDAHGQVLYDNLLPQTTQLENHAGRPEIRQAAKDGKGSDIRTSTSNNREYLYYAKQFDGYYIRMALPYDIHVRHFLKPGNGFLYFILALFGVGLLFINYVAGRFGKSIRQLRDFSLAAGSDTPDIAAHAHFPDDELGDIGAKIVHDYLQLKTHEKKIALEKEKLLQHVQNSAEGICFFTPDRKVAFYNSLFLQYLNIMGEEITTDPAHILEEELFAAVDELPDGKGSRQTTETQIVRQGKCFLMRVNRFEDNSFEVVLNDITPSEKTRRLKQELTGHIAHELRTPVTSIRGYLETILEQPLTPEKKRHFLQKAYRQTLMLSELIRDMNLLTKLEETSGTFALKPLAIDGIIKTVADDMAALLEAQDITIETDLPQSAWVYGNESLLYAVFRNLMENVVHHAGKQVKIFITQYAADKGFLHFSFADTGAGIADHRHLPRLFERFYRVTEGRTRDTGGTGLGLAIVKNIIVFHKGTITVKNRAGGGLQFLFSLPEAESVNP